MNTVKIAGFRKRARECVELAQIARTPEQRTMLLHIAETWLRLADDSGARSEEGQNGASMSVN